MPSPRRQHPTIAAKTVGEWDDDTRIQEFLRIQDDYECAGLRPTRQAVAEDTVRAWSQASLITNYLSLRQDYESALGASFGTYGARVGTARADQRRPGFSNSRDKKRRRRREESPHQSLDEATAEGGHIAPPQGLSLGEGPLDPQRALEEVQLEMTKLKEQSDKWENEARDGLMEISQLIQKHSTEARSLTATIQEQTAAIASLKVQVKTHAIELEEKEKHCIELGCTQNTLRETLLTAENLRAELAKSRSLLPLAREARMKVARDNERLRGELSTSTSRLKEKDQLVESLQAQLVSRDKQIAVKTQLCFDLQQMLWQEDFRNDVDNVWLPARFGD